jgi:hypothetical protein
MVAGVFSLFLYYESLYTEECLQDWKNIYIKCVVFFLLCVFIQFRLPHTFGDSKHERGNTNANGYLNSRKT